MRASILLVAFAFAVGCGDGGGSKPNKPRGLTTGGKVKPVKPGTPSADVAGGGGAPKKGKGKGKRLWTYPKVDDEKYRRAFAQEDFAPDISGDVNRDPFRSYLVEASTSNSNKGALDVDECDRRTVAQQYGLRDLKLVAIVKKGTTAYAMFIDSQRDGHIAKRGDCLSKDKARLKEIGTSNIIVEVRGQAPPGQPAPEPREEEWRLHPKEIELRPEAIEGGSTGTGETP